MGGLARHWLAARSIAAGVGAVALLATSSLGVPARGGGASIAPLIAPLILQLADPSPPVRKAAHEQLLKIGRPARAALLAASSGGPLQERQAARALLRELPLFDESDAPALRDALAAYAATPPIAQADHVLRLVKRGTDLGLAAAARIVLEASDDDEMLWPSVAGMSPDEQRRLVTSPGCVGAEPIGPARLFLFGAATFDQDRPRAVKLLERSLAELSIVPPAAMPGVRRLADLLAADARAAKDGPRELRLRCDAAMIAPPAVASPTSTLTEPSDFLLAYFETRLRLWSLDGYDEDLVRLGVPADGSIAALVSAVVSSPPFRPSTPPRDGDPLGPIRGVPHAIWSAIDAIDPNDAIIGAEMLSRAGESALADAIAARLLLTMTDGHEPSVGARARLLAVRVDVATTPSRRQAMTIALRSLLGSGGDQRDPLAANGPQGAVVIFDPLIVPGANEMLAVRRLAELRRALESDNGATADAILDRLGPINFDDSELAIDSIYAFEARGRIAEADEIYNNALDAEQAYLEASPDDPSAMNRTAWLCARTGHQIAYAYGLASRAVAMNPQNPAELDTLAETAHRMGRSQEAIDAESRALQLKPGDPFMTRQLDRFKAGLAPGEAERALTSESWER